MSRLIIYFLLVFSFTAHAQEGDTCILIENKKALELFEKGTNRKKYDKIKRLAYLRDAVDLEPDYVDAHFQLAVEIIRTAKYKGSKLDPAEPHLLAVIENCPGYHSDPYFHLGEINLARENYKEAIKYYKQFLKFESEDDKKFSRNYEKNYALAKDDLKYAKFYHEVYDNPVPFNPKVVNSVSSKVDEYLPLISPDNKSMYFTRRQVKKEKVKQTVYTSDKVSYIERFSKAANNNELTFSEGDPMPAPFNQEDNYNYGGATITIDNKHLFLTICKPGKMNYINCDIYSSDYVYGFVEVEGKEMWHWTELQNMGPNINGDLSWEGQPSISADGKHLYFASAREDSRGIDIYMSTKENGEWGFAKNLGEPINTAGNDKTPFIHSDSQTLYYASDGHLGFGGFDVFLSRADKNNNWQEPKNIGYPINSRADEHGFIVSTDGKRVYYGADKRKKEGFGLDIFSFELYPGARPKKVAFVTGNIKDEKGEVPENTTVELKNTKTNEVVQVAADSVDGSFAIVQTIEENEDIVMNVKSEGKAFNSTIITKHADGKTVIDYSINVEEINPGQPHKINDIYYKTSSAEIDESSKFILNEFADYLKENTDLKIEIHGHTDNVGAHDDNMALSGERSFAVMAYLQERGVDKNRLSFHGYGETRPVATNDTPEGRALNRRTEFVVVK